MENMDEKFLTHTEMSDFEAVDYYQNIIRKLKMAKLMVNMKKTQFNDVDVTINNLVCTFSAKQLLEHIDGQMLFFIRMLKQVEDRLMRSEGKVG